MSTYKPVSLSASPPSPPDSLHALELSESFPDNENDRPPLTRHHRSSTLTSLGGFEFRADLLPLTPSSVEDGVQHKGEEKHVSMLQGMGLIIGTQVGSGIFSSPGVVVAEVGSVGASLLVWVASAVLAWTGASSFAELGCAIPISGGAQAYLAYAYGPMLSYLYTWTAVSTIKPGSSAIISLIFGEYINRMIYHAATGDEESIVPEWTFKITAIFAVILSTILNLASRSMGTRASVVITTVKMLSLLFVGVLGVIYLARNGPGPALSSNIFAGTSHSPGNFAIAIYSGLWAYDGWDACSVSSRSLKGCHYIDSLMTVHRGRDEGHPSRSTSGTAHFDDGCPVPLPRGKCLIFHRLGTIGRCFH
jgi:amino acid permease